MYKYLIIGIAFVFTLSGNYYIRKAGGAELISKAVSGETKTNSVPLPIEDMVGLYVCDTQSGCNNKHVLLLKNDQTSELLQISNDVEITDDKFSEIATTIEERLSQSQNDVILNTSTSTENSEINLNYSVKDDSNNTEQEVSTTTINRSDSFINEERQSNDNEIKNSSHLTSFFELNGNSEYILEKGVWDLDIQNILIITIKERGTSTYQVPQKIVVRNIDNLVKFSKISYTKSNYEGMINPIFVKQE